MFATAPLAPAAPVLVSDAVLDELDRIPVGPALAAALDELPPPTATGWDNPRTQVRVAAKWAAVASWAEARSLHQLGHSQATVAATDDPLEELNLATDVALENRRSEGWAHRQLDLAAQLHGRLPAMANWLVEGELSVDHARALQRAVETADDETARRIDAKVSPRAIEHRWTPADLAAAARRLLLRLDPDGGAARHDAALDRDAGVDSGPAADGLAWISATGDAVSVADIMAAVDDRARRLQALVPDTPIGRARFAALGDLVLGQGFTLFDHVLGGTVPAPERTTVEEPADRRRIRRREVIVTVDLLTLLGLRNDPAQLTGYGPVPARIARLLLEDATLRRLVTDPVTGEALDLGRTSYAPGARLVTAVRATDRHCRFPGCRRARNTEIDHRIEGSAGGPTEIANLQVLCKAHHALKTAGLWQVTRLRDGTDIWTGPDGQTAIRKPDPDPPPDDDSG